MLRNASRHYHARLPGKFAYSDKNGDIWIVDGDGSGGRRVTRSGAGIDFDPSFAPDGRRLVFRTTRGHHLPDRLGTGLDSIFVIGADGRHDYPIHPPAGALFPDWSPNGRRIAMSTLGRDGRETIITIAPDGTKSRDLHLPNGGEGASWSPDSRKIAYDSHAPASNDWHVWVMDASGTRQRQLTTGAHSDHVCCWSPDGRSLLFYSDRSGRGNVWVMGADGSSARRLADVGPDQGASPDVWLPDGRIVFSISHGQSPWPRWFVMDADGRYRRPLPQLAGAGDPLDWVGR